MGRKRPKRIRPRSHQAEGGDVSSQLNGHRDSPRIIFDMQAIEMHPVQYWLDANKRSQSWLAKEAGIPLSNLNKMLNGALNISDAAALKIAEAIGEPVRFVLGGPVVLQPVVRK